MIDPRCTRTFSGIMHVTCCKCSPEALACAKKEDNDMNKLMTHSDYLAEVEKIIHESNCKCMHSNIVFKYGIGGAFMCDSPIDGITEELNDDNTKFYGARYMIGESMSRSAAEKIMLLLGGRELLNIPNNCIRRHSSQIELGNHTGDISCLECNPK